MADKAKKEDNLDHEPTFVGEKDGDPESVRSIGDENTRGDAEMSSLDEFQQSIGGFDEVVDLESRYELQGEVGAGGMGKVFKAVDKRLGRVVALKFLREELGKSTRAIERFMTEAKSIATLNHYNIVQIFEMERSADGFYIVMEYVDGGSLADRLAGGPLDVETAVEITVQVCDALSLAHDHGIIHRDIKPANILLTREGEPKLTDFGLARQTEGDHGQTQVGAVLGTIDFMSPEHRRDATAVDARSDLWSLAATLYQMVTGKSPKVIRLRDVPPQLHDVISKGLEEDPEDRCEDARAFKQELLDAARSQAAMPAVQLQSGICPSCGAANEQGRKFCQQCARSLLVPCLACNEDNAVWHNVCGECGAKQDQLREELLLVYEQKVQQAEELLGNYLFEDALGVLTEVLDSEQEFAATAVEAAGELTERVKAQRDEQFQLRDQLVELAGNHLRHHDYSAAERELRKIPEPVRNDAIGIQLVEVTETNAELSLLLEVISEGVKSKSPEGLLAKTTRYLQLKPNDEKVAKLHEWLQVKERKEAEEAELEVQQDRRIDAAISQAQAYFDDYADQRCLEVLDELKKTHPLPRDAVTLREISRSRLDEVKQFSQQIKDLDKDAPDVLALLEQLSLLRPKSEAVLQRLQQARNVEQVRVTSYMNRIGRSVRPALHNYEKFVWGTVCLVLFIAAFFVLWPNVDPSEETTTSNDYGAGGDDAQIPVSRKGEQGESEGAGSEKDPEWSFQLPEHLAEKRPNIIYILFWVAVAVVTLFVLWRGRSQGRR